MTILYSLVYNDFKKKNKYIKGELNDKDNGCTLSVGDYRHYKPVTIWETKSILHKLKYISNKEYENYL